MIPHSMISNSMFTFELLDNVHLRISKLVKISRSDIFRRTECQRFETSQNPREGHSARCKILQCEHVIQYLHRSRRSIMDMDWHIEIYKMGTKTQLYGLLVAGDYKRGSKKGIMRSLIWVFHFQQDSSI